MGRRSPERRVPVPVPVPVTTAAAKAAPPTPPSGDGNRSRRLHPGKQRDPDPADVAALYSAGRTERDIARELGVSRERVARSLAAAGLDRRSTQRPCPVDEDELRRRIKEGASQAELARLFGASAGTVNRWLAEAGIAPTRRQPDPTRWYLRR